MNNKPITTVAISPTALDGKTKLIRSKRIEINNEYLLICFNEIYHLYSLNYFFEFKTMFKRQHRKRLLDYNTIIYKGTNVKDSIRMMIIHLYIFNRVHSLSFLKHDIYILY